MGGERKMIKIEKSKGMKELCVERKRHRNRNSDNKDKYRVRDGNKKYREMLVYNYKHFQHD